MNEYEHIPIIFEGQRLPEEVMGVSIIEYVTNGLPESVAEWLWRLPICWGMQKTCSSHLVIENCTIAVDFLIDHKNEIIKGIRDRFPKYQAVDVFGKWLHAFNTMRSIAETRDECNWIAEGTELSPGEIKRRAELMLKCIDAEAARTKPKWMSQ